MNIFKIKLDIYTDKHMWLLHKIEIEKSKQACRVPEI